MSGAPGPRFAVITLCSSPRLAHVRRQLAALAGARDRVRVVVWVGDDDPPPLDADDIVRVPPGPHGLRLAAARNAGATAAQRWSAEQLVFLDADCVPGPDLLARYGAAARCHPDAVLCGPVTYLADGVDASDAAALEAATSPHPARPAPPPGSVVVASEAEYPLFWSLSFSVRADTWNRVVPFDEGYEGYGGEDTDFAFGLREREVPLVWVGGAHAYHQYHPVESPPWRHLDDILRNGARFAARWGEWPMTGWLDAFARAGAIARDRDGAWRRVDPAA